MDEKQFQLLFIDYYAPLLSFACRYVNEQEASEDIVQDVFVRLWEMNDRLLGIEELSAYIYQMVRYRCLNYLRTQKSEENAVRQMENETVEERDAYIEEEMFRRYKKALEMLPPACGNIFALMLEGYKAREIAEKLNIAVETVKKQKQIARRILKEKLKIFLLFFQ